MPSMMTVQGLFKYPTEWRQKRWGRARSIGQGVDLLQVLAGGKSSIHTHVDHCNRFTVVRGRFRITEYGSPGDGGESVIITDGESWCVEPGVWHSFECLEPGELVEVYWQDESPWLVEDHIERSTE